MATKDLLVRVLGDTRDVEAAFARSSRAANRFGASVDTTGIRWSERWHDDPPLGTIVNGHERVIYLGNGQWQPLG